MKDAILVEGLSKEYAIVPRGQETLRERVARMLRSPLKRSPRETIWAIRDMSFQIGEGESVGIVGRNGAGKSTLLKLLAKITYPTLGKVTTRGRVAALLEVGTGFHNELTGRENIYLNGSILGLRKREIDARLDAIIDFSGVKRFIDTPIKRYSSGMRLRLGFAVAAHLDPDVLLIDEVLAVGDAGFQKKCLTTVEQLRAGGRAVLFVSHNMIAVEGLCSRAIWIEDGRVRMDGRSEDVVRSYMSTFADQQQAAGDLRNVEGRYGTGEVRYTRVEFLTVEGIPLQVIRSGDRIIFRFHYLAIDEIPFPSLGFRLYNDVGVLITSTSTWYHGIAIPLIHPGEGSLDLDVACLNLLPGRYNLTLMIRNGAHIYEALEHSISLEVAPSNPYGSTRQVDGRDGIVYFPQKWDLTGMRRGLERVTFSDDVVRRSTPGKLEPD